MTLAASQKNSNQGRLFVVSGPSGAGKGTLVTAALEAFPNLSLSISATTRKPRAGDVEGKTYYFVSDEQFDELLENGGLLEWAQVHGCRYGTLADEVNKALNAGKDLILEIDLQGFRQIKTNRDDVFSIFIAPPSMNELKRRLEYRGTEDANSIKDRLATAQVELGAQDSYTVTIINDDLEEAKHELIEIIEQQLGRQDAR